MGPGRPTDYATIVLVVDIVVVVVVGVVAATLAHNSSVG
jgi:hypothetical protein